MTSESFEGAVGVTANPDGSFRRRPRSPESAETLPPHSMEAEQGLLGCIIERGIESLTPCIEKLRGPEAFYDLRHRTLYQVILALEERAAPVDLVSVVSLLRDRGQLEAVGGVAYLSSLMSSGGTSVEYYADIVAEKALLRRMIQHASESIGAVHQCDDPKGLVERYVTKAIELTDAQVAAQVHEIKELVRGAVNHVQTSSEHRAKGLMLGYPTGFSYFDKKTGGLEKKQVYMIGGRPSTGKTSWACSLIINLAVRQRVRVGFISIEMSSNIIAIRMLCAMARANFHQVNSGYTTERDLAKMTIAAGELSRAPMDIIDTPGMTPAQLRAAGRRLVARGCQVIVIDHLHEVTVPSADGANAEQVQAAQAAEAARWIARTCDVPVVALAQLSRTFESEQAKSKFRIPRMTDLRGSGFMEQKADLIGILYKDEARVPDSSRDDEDSRRRVNFNDMTDWPVTMEICKQRNGPTGPVEFTFLREAMLYVDGYLGTGSKIAADRKRAKEEETFE